MTSFRPWEAQDTCIAEIQSASLAVLLKASDVQKQCLGPLSSADMIIGEVWLSTGSGEDVPRSAIVKKFLSLTPNNEGRSETNTTV